MVLLVVYQCSNLVGFAALVIKPCCNVLGIDIRHFEHHLYGDCNNKCLNDPRKGLGCVCVEGGGGGLGPSRGAVFLY